LSATRANSASNSVPEGRGAVVERVEVAVVIDCSPMIEVVLVHWFAGGMRWQARHAQVADGVELVEQGSGYRLEGSGNAPARERFGRN
jgi:hypothetical protein